MFASKEIPKTESKISKALPRVIPITTFVAFLQFVSVKTSKAYIKAGPGVAQARKWIKTRVAMDIL